MGTVIVRANGHDGSVHIQADDSSTVGNVTVGDRVYSVHAGKVTVGERRAMRPLWQRLLLVFGLYPLLGYVFGYTIVGVVTALLRQ